MHWPTLGFLKKKAWRLIGNPVFPVLTICGNLLIVLGALGLYWCEKGINPHIHTMLDTIWWAVATVTTVGYGDVSPITTWGKIIGLIMMVFGTALFWCYTALFAEAFIRDEIEDFESELRSIDEKLQSLKRQRGK